MVMWSGFTFFDEARGTVVNALKTMDRGSRKIRKERAATVNV